MLDRLPTPFGLVRTGVAPDHPEVKSVQKDFEKVAEDPRFHFFGNVTVGVDVQVSQLRELYDVLVFAYGAAEDRKVGIPGEDELEGVLSARTFVNWYNGHPEYAQDAKLTALVKEILMQKNAQVVVLGQGNVALDCARILAKQPKDLATTDICEHALDVLRESHVGKVSVVGRRGHGQAAFTIKELRELSRIEGATCIVHPDEIAAGLTPFTAAELEASRPRKRLADLVQSLPPAAAATDSEKEDTRTVALRFLLMPKAILPDPARPSRVGAILMERTRLEEKEAGGRVVAVGTGETVELPCQMVLRSIGYKSLPLEGVPFDTKKSILPNKQGRILTVTDTDTPKPVPGLYCTGWVKRGPTGIINTNIVDARETVAAILEDATQGKLNPNTKTKNLPAGGLLDLLAAGQKKRPEEVVTWAGYQKIDAFEGEKGAAKGKPREKVTDTAELLRIGAGV